MNARQYLRRGLALALDDVASGRADLRRAMALFRAREDRQGELIAAAALVQFIGIADDDYAGFQPAIEVVAAAQIDTEGIAHPDHRMLARSGLLVAAGYAALGKAVVSAQAAALARDLGDEGIAPAVRCCAGLTILACFDANFDLERTLWLELAMRPVLAGGRGSTPGDRAPLGSRLAGEWQHALSQALYQCAAPARARGAASAHGALFAAQVPAIDLKRALVEAQLAIGDGQVDAGQAALARAEPLLDPRVPRQASWWHLLRSRLDLIEGHPRQALTHARLALRLTRECGYPERWMGVTVMQEGQIQMDCGEYLSALPFFERAGRAASGLQADFCWCLAHLARALGAIDSDAGLARSELAQGLGLARRLHWLNFLRACPRVAAQVCSLALEHGIEVAFALEVITARGLDAVRPDLATWPWPIRVRTLGRFQIELDGQPLAFAGKVARKPLELLQFAIASGGSDVSIASVTFALWRDLEGDKARLAFNAALYRLRKLLMSDDAVVLELGRLSLNPRRMWVDCLAFEQLVDGAIASPVAGLSAPAVQAVRRAVEMYSGHFLPTSEDEPWQAAYRSRLAAKFKRSVAALARQELAEGDTRLVRAMLERALELHPMAEDLARELMRLLSDLGEQAAALQVFDRCRAAIRQGLDAKPSPATLELVARIRTLH